MQVLDISQSQVTVLTESSANCVITTSVTDFVATGKVVDIHKRQNIVARAKANPEIEIINWSGDERAKFRRIAQQEWETWAGKTAMTQRYYDAVVAYLKGRNLL